MSFVILNQMYFPIILSLSSDGQQFYQYQENEQSHFSCYFCLNFFIFFYLQIHCKYVRFQSTLLLLLGGYLCWWTNSL